MTWVYNWFTNGVTLPAISLNELYQNGLHAREEASYHTLMTVGRSTLAYTASSTYNWYLKIDGTSVGTGFSGTGSMSRADINLTTASVAVGAIHTLEVAGMVVRFYRSPDMGFLSLWLTLAVANATEDRWDWTITNLTVIGHRDSMSWT